MLERRSPKSASPGLGLRYEWIVIRPGETENSAVQSGRDGVAR